ncbi:3'-5' exonuclease [Nocardia acidivorans]|uniref:3'-5' exonuclease n=1 Tax=Nocardia acidivorans TaxID=404580 RepID=UPI000A76A101|nr:3'-5' exonuclease [Nocardia acidivorans]
MNAYTEARERVAEHSILVRPERSTVSEFCTELTTLTPELVATGISFAEACALLRTEFHADSRPWASWGAYDRQQFERQCAATEVPYPFGSRHTNAKLAFSASRGTGHRFGMAGALKAAELPLEGTHHRGGDDAWNIAALIIDMMRRGDWPE